MSSWAELDEAVETLQSNGCKDLTVLQCTSEYPCPPEQAGLNVLNQMKARYKDVNIGYSDHTMGVAVPLAAVIKGASVIEKHFTLSQKMYGSDAMNSTEPDEFKRLVDEIRQVEVALAQGR
jgi:N,N'-diacetyllegionaminate synthase